jgi:peptidoglycan/LPS O-acetylase OafA/YrhL
LPVLDSLRGIAILLVLVCHAHLLPGGALGVDLFFVLSGFLITSLLITEFGRTDGIALRAFFRRRALRLFPALIVMLAVYLLASGIFALLGYLRDSQFTAAATAAAAGFAYVTNLVAEVGLGEAGPLSHLWSLGQEEQFYLVWPPVLLLLLRRRVRPRTLALGLLTLAVYVATWRIVLAGAGGSYEHIWYGADTRADSIILGCAAGVAFSYGLVRTLPGWLPVVAAIAACFAVGAIELSRSPVDSGLFLPLFVLAASVVVFSCAHRPDSTSARLLDVGVLRRLGKISYGLYLWHLPIFSLLGWPAGLPVSILVAATSFRYVEQPFLSMRHGRREHSAPTVRPAALTARPAHASASSVSL